MPSFQTLVSSFVVLGAVASVSADMRIASLQKNGFKDAQIAKNPALAKGRTGNLVARANVDVFPYQVPQTFGIAKLAAQEKNNNDNFLRSNVDNEANKRNTNLEAPKDMTPCRQDGVGSTAVMQLQNGQTADVPLQFNNPHDGECEVNIWLMNNSSSLEVAPISRFACGGGYAQNRPNFTIPSDFPSVCGAGAGCQMQLYWHSVEPRTYTVCNNVEITGGAGFIHRRDSSVTIKPAILYADSFDTAHIDSTHSGYRGQQPDQIGANLAARITMQSFTGNGGLLKDAEPANVIATRNKLKAQVEAAVKAAEKDAIKENKAAQASLDAGAGKGANGAFEGDKYNVVLNDQAKRQFTNTYVTNVDYVAIKDSFMPKFAAAGLSQQGTAFKSDFATPNVFGMKKDSLKVQANAAALPANFAKALGSTATAHLARRAAGELNEDSDVNPDDLDI